MASSDAARVATSLFPHANDKGGQSGVDRDKINEIILEVSGNSPHVRPSKYQKRQQSDAARTRSSSLSEIGSTPAGTPRRRSSSATRRRSGSRRRRSRSRRSTARGGPSRGTTSQNRRKSSSERASRWPPRGHAARSLTLICSTPPSKFATDPSSRRSPSRFSGRAVFLKSRWLPGLSAAAAPRRRRGWAAAAARRLTSRRRRGCFAAVAAAARR